MNAAPGHAGPESSRGVRRIADRAGAAFRQALPESMRREWDQFRLLARDAVRQLIDTALLSRDADPMEYALWMLALVATPPAFFAMQQIRTYPSLMHAPLELVQQVALSHRLFFIIYAMLAAALLAALTWEAVFPDGRDQEIVGVLPVRPRTFAAARLAAAVIVCVVFSAAVNLPAALMYSTFCAGHPAFGNIPSLFAGHFLATMIGALLVFFSLLTARGLAAVILGARAGAWLGAALQLVAVVAMFEVFFFLPGVLDTLAASMRSGPASMAVFPPVWFAALHAWLAGEAGTMLEQAAFYGVLAFSLSALVIVPIYLVPARWLGRRALESRARERAAGLTTTVDAVSWTTRATPAVRGVFQFAMASLFRSRRHLMILATYLGMAIAVCGASILVLEVRGTFRFDAPAEWVLALPLVFIFFGVLGLRASFRIPTEIEANWPFRLAQPALATGINAAVLVIMTVVVVPTTLMTAAITLPMWPAPAVLQSAGLLVLAGWTLIELVLFRWTKIPFACGHAPSTDVLKAWWPLYVIGLYLFAFRISDWQVAALTSTRALLAYLAASALVIGGVRLLRPRSLRHSSLEFDVTPSQTERLNLSEALN